MSATQMYPSLWGGFPWFNVHEDRQGAYYGCCCSPLYQLSSWLIFSLGKSIILVIGESPTTYTYTRVGWKVQRLTKIVSWNVIKILFFNIVPRAVHTFFLSVLQCLYPTGQKIHQHQIWLYHVNFLAYQFFSQLHSVCEIYCINLDWEYITIAIHRALL